jgi:hypothetical protein
MRTCALLSLASVSCNTPKTFEKIVPMQWITFIVDIVVTVLFTSEMVAKMHIRGILKVMEEDINPKNLLPNIQNNFREKNRI